MGDYKIKDEWPAPDAFDIAACIIGGVDPPKKYVVENSAGETRSIVAWDKADLGKKIARGD